MKQKLAAFAFLLAGLPAAVSADPMQIVWLQPSLPPAFIADGPGKGSGFLDMALQKQIQPALANFQHQIRVVPLARRDAELKANAAACTPGVFRTPEREKYMVFSRPYLVMLPPGIFVHTRNLHRLTTYLNSRGEVSLGKLLSGANLRVGVTTSRSYGPKLDGVLASYQGKPNLYNLSAENAGTSLMRMLLANRLDIIPAYAYEGAYFGVETGEASDDLHFYPLEEQPGYVLNVVGCAQGPQGEAVVATLNAALEKPAVREAMASYYELWLGENGKRLSRKARQQAEKDGVFN